MNALADKIVATSSEGFSARLIETREELEQLAPEWNNLLHMSAADTIFLTWEWITSWLDTIAPKSSIMVVEVRDTEQRLIGLAPFYRSPLYLFGCIPYQCLRVLGDSNSGAEYPDIIIQKGLENKIIPLIAEMYQRHRKKWDWIWLLNIAGWTGALERITMVFQPGTVIIKKSSYSFSSITLPESWLKFTSQIPKHRLNNLRRLERISDQHSPQVLHCVRAEELSSYLDNFFRLHNKRWQCAGQKGSFQYRPKMDDFYRDFASKALDKGWLGFFSLFLDGVIGASQYGYVYNNVYHALQEGFDPDGLPGQGNLLRAAVVTWCIEQKIHEYDFLGMHSKHKAYWGGIERYGWRLFLGRRCLKNLPLKLAGIWPSGRFIKYGKN
jgi:CelD/BcsL family acetyltransferase involved in cellulose biosynthesis